MVFSCCVHASKVTDRPESPPRLYQDVTLIDSVIKNVEAPSPAALGSHEKLALEFSYFLCGVVGPLGHALALTSRHKRNQSRAPSLRRVSATSTVL